MVVHTAYLLRTSTRYSRFGRSIKYLLYRSAGPLGGAIGPIGIAIGTIAYPYSQSRSFAFGVRDLVKTEV
jgi:hypothetical protein